MTQHIHLMAHYNLWADRRIFKLLGSIDSKLLDEPVKSSFPTLRLTLGHMYDAEKIWLSRLGGTSLDHWPSDSLELFETELLLEESKRCLAFVKGLNQQEMNSLCTYQNQKGDSFSQPAWQILTHVFNHATYHRGQLVTILRALGVRELPATDLIYYLRELRD